VRRRLSITCSIISLLLAGAALWLWGRGRSIGDTVLLTQGPSAAVVGTLGRSYFTQGWSSGGGVRLLAGWMDSAPTSPSAISTAGLHFQHGSYDPGSRASAYPTEHFLRTGDVAHDAAGFEFFSRDYDITSYRERSWSVTLPMWAVILLTLALPMRTATQLWRARRRRRRLSAGMCPDCGYDLRGSPERCPECGRETPPRI
jgi:hypothetical protein